MSVADEIRAKRTTSTKWMKYSQEVLPAWIADMDLGVAPAIASELIERIDNGDLGYPSKDIATSFVDTFADRYIEKFNTPLDPDLGIASTDVVQSIYLAILTLTEPGDGVIVQTPIYPPFLGSIRSTGRQVQENALIWTDDSWEIDFDELERLASDAKTTLFLLCSPHNPTGRVFTQTELVKMAEICAKHGVLVVSDEIHCDIVFAPHFHIPFASISPDFAPNVITMTSATKSFNVAGMRCSIVHFGSVELKDKYLTYDAHVRGSISTLSMLAAMTAWRKGDSWLASTLETLRRNRERVARFVKDGELGLDFHSPQGTYLAWLDFRKSKAGANPHEFLIENAKVALSPGEDFGDPGIGWARLNFATQPEVLEEMLSRISSALS